MVPTYYSYDYTFTNGESVQVEAVPASGYEFSNWSGSLDGEDNPATIEMTCAKSITANFSKSKVVHTLTMQVNGNGSITPPAGSHGYDGGTVISIIATPDAGWRFVGWTGDVADGSSATAKLTMDSDRTVVANFSQLVHTLTVQLNGNGSTTPAAGSYDYSEGALVSITATPDNGWRFDGWTGDVADGSSATATLTMDSDKSAIANFSQVTYALTVQLNGNGSTTPAAGVHDYGEGSLVSITATADNGWRFDGWTGDVADPSSAMTTVTMDSDMTATANFSEVRTIQPIRAGWLWPDGVIGGLALAILLVVVKIVRGRHYYD
jgi:uncharacterized repeat protein (TIGR02543 family)